MFIPNLYFLILILLTILISVKSSKLKDDDNLTLIQVEYGYNVTDFTLEVLNRDNAEINDNGWESAGFFRIASARPQRWSLTVLHPKEDSTSAAEFFTFNGGDTITVDCPEGECTFGISAIDPAIRSRASFTVQTEQVP